MSFDFSAAGRSAEASRVAEAVGGDSRGHSCGVIVWNLGRRISGLEVYESESGSTTELTAIEVLRRWESV